ncbi:29087_t:CDS:2, partial [Racocetra persica]
MSIIEAGRQDSIVIKEKDNKFNILSERDYNAYLRKELRNLVLEFVRKYKLNKTRQPEMQQISEYIMENNCEAFLNRYMDILDVEKTFRNSLKISLNSP